MIFFNSSSLRKWWHKAITNCNKVYFLLFSKTAVSSTEVVTVKSRPDGWVTAGKLLKPDSNITYWKSKNISFLFFSEMVLKLKPRRRPPLSKENLISPFCHNTLLKNKNCTYNNVSMYPLMCFAGLRMRCMTPSCLAPSHLLCLPLLGEMSQ